jgi:phosphoinositide-3-kinase, regulatory subunit 4
MPYGWRVIDKVYSRRVHSNHLDHRLLLVVATNLSRVVAFDLRSMEILFSLQNPPHHGTPTCFCIDKSRRTWLLLGTSRGILDLWDLRFLLRLKAWGLPPYNGIKRLHVHPTRGHGKWVCVAGGTSHGEITVWDIDKLQCREVYRANGSQDTLRNYDAYRIDDDKPEGPLGRFTVDPDHKLDNGLGSGAEWRVNSIVVGKDNVRPDGSVDLKSNAGFIISVGADRRIRFWDLGKAEASLVVSGLDVEEAKPTFSSMQVSPSLSITTERRSSPSNTANQKESAKSKRSGGRPSRQAFISLQQEKLLKNHLDAILDVALVESPFAMIVSVDRAGCINISA